MGWLTAILIVALLVIWIVCGYYITQASVDLTSYKSKDKDLDNAYWYTFWAAFVTWFLVGAAVLLIIGLIVLAIVAAPEEAGGASAIEGLSGVVGQINELGWIKWLAGWFVTGTLITATVLVALTGILAALAADSIHSSPELKEGGLKQAYDDCVIAAIIALTSVGLLLIAAIIFEILDYRKNHPSNPAPTQEQVAAITEARQGPPAVPPRDPMYAKKALRGPAPPPPIPERDPEYARRALQGAPPIPPRPSSPTKYFTPTSSPSSSPPATTQSVTLADLQQAANTGLKIYNSFGGSSPITPNK